VIVPKPTTVSPRIAADSLSILFDFALDLGIIARSSYVAVTSEFEAGGAAKVIWRKESVSTRAIASSGELKVHEASYRRLYTGRTYL
jgi:hypothetical protein